MRADAVGCAPFPRSVYIPGDVHNYTSC
jgi:hypothetical protein